MKTGQSAIRFEWSNQGAFIPHVGCLIEASDTFRDGKWIFTATVDGFFYTGQGETRIEGALDLVRSWALAKPQVTKEDDHDEN